MKKLFVSTLLFLLVLTACTAASGTEETADTPTTESLDAAPTATEELPVPTAEPTATEEPTATPEPEPTETAVPTATETTAASPTEAVPTSTTQTETPQEEAPPETAGTIPEEFRPPEGAVIVFTQTGGFAGFDNTWVFYPDGRVTLNGVEQTQLPPERIDALINDLDELGFFETSYTTKPGEFCCDFFEYTLAVQTQSRQNFISFSEGDPNLPQNIWDILALMQRITEEAQVR